MPNFTRAISVALDSARKVALGADTHELLDHAPVGERGYVTIAPVLKGWHLQPGNVGEAATLKIAESAAVTKEDIQSAVAFAVSGEVYKIDDNNLAAPTGENIRVWSFKVKLTGETHVNE